MTDKIISLAKARGDLSADEVLENAKGSFESVIVLGYDKDGYLDAYSTLDLKHTEIIWLIEVFKNKIINGDYAE